MNIITSEKKIDISICYIVSNILYSVLNETLYLPKRHNSGFQVAKSCISPLDWKPASKQTWQAAWGKGAKGKEWTRCLCERCDCRSRFHSPNSMHLDSGLWFSADMMSSDALSALFFSYIGGSTEQNYSCSFPWTQWVTCSYIYL